MAITAIARYWSDAPNIVGIITTDNLVTITGNGYLTAQADNIEALQNGEFEWQDTDLVLIFYNGGHGFFTPDYTVNFTFVASTTIPGALSEVLPSGQIFVGDVTNVAAPVAMTGDVAIDNAGVTTIQPEAVTSDMLALDTIQYVKVPMTAAEWNGMFAAPFLMIAAAGVNTLIQIKQVLFELDYGGAQFAAGGASALQYTATVNGAGTLASVAIPAATFNAMAADSVIMSAGALASAAAAVTVNQGIYMSNLTGAFTTGTSTVDVHIWYSVVATTF